MTEEARAATASGSRSPRRCPGEAGTRAGRAPPHLARRRWSLLRRNVARGAVVPRARLHAAVGRCRRPPAPRRHRSWASLELPSVEAVLKRDVDGALVAGLGLRIEGAHDRRAACAALVDLLADRRDRVHARSEE